MEKSSLWNARGKVEARAMIVSFSLSRYRDNRELVARKLYPRILVFQEILDILRRYFVTRGGEYIYVLALYLLD